MAVPAPPGAQVWTQRSAGKGLCTEEASRKQQTSWGTRVAQSPGGPCTAREPGEPGGAWAAMESPGTRGCKVKKTLGCTAQLPLGCESNPKAVPFVHLSRTRSLWRPAEQRASEGCTPLFKKGGDGAE